MSFLFVRCLLLAALIYSVTSQSINPSTQTNYSLLAFDGSYWRVGIRSYKGTISLIQPIINQPFSFINDDQAGSEYSTGQNWHAHGDVTFRVRNPDQPNDPYVQYSTVDAAGGPAIGVKPSSANALAAFDVTNLIKPGHGLQIIKEYSVSRYNHSNVAFDKLTLTIRVQNTLKRRVELGAFGVSALFSSNWNNMDLPTVATHCSLAEPFIGSNHGFIKVARLTGEGSVLLVTPVLGHATNTSVYQSSIAAWRHLKAEDRTPTGYGFEGHYEMMALTKAWQDNEWQSVDTSQAWSEPRSRILNPNQTIYFAYEYQLIQDVRSVDNYLVSQEKVNIRGQPGYVVSMPDETQHSNFDQYLFMYVPSHMPNVTLNVTGEGSVELSWNNAFFGVYRRYDIKPLRVGRVKIAVHFSHIENYQTDTYIHLNVLPSFSTQLDRLGSFTEKRQFFTDETDPFGRAYSVMPFDFEADEIILQDSRSYVVGLSDEAGAGPGLAYVSKNRFWPVKSQIHQLDLYINRTLWGVKSSIPFPVSIQNANHSIHASLFWYPGMPGYKYTVTDGWNQDRGSQLWRSYNYVHPTVLYHSMYRLARDNDRLTTLYTWDWYLKQAYLTFVAMFDNAPYYTQFGLMEGSVFLDLMRDLDLEGMTAEFADMQQREQGRLAVWQKLPFPFGSEMAWDSTGQEELLMTAHEFGLYDLSNQSLSAILGYTHSVPSWAYHGSSRRFWDYWINGKPKYALPYPERGLHHYGSSLNGKPLLYAYQSNPDDVYLLEVGIGSMTGVLTNIQPSGASGMSFHGDNGLLKHDPFDADYGCALYGHVSSSASYYIHHPMFGPSCYLCHWNATADAVLVTPHDSLRVRMYIEQIGTLIEMETGHIASVEVHSSGKQLIITFANDPNPLFSQYRVKISHPAPCDSRPGCDLAVTSPSSKIVRGAYVFDINTQSAQFSWGGSNVDTKFVDE